jgi:hypothetical protein
MQAVSSHHSQASALPILPDTPADRNVRDSAAFPKTPSKGSDAHLNLFLIAPVDDVKRARKALCTQHSSSTLQSFICWKQDNSGKETPQQVAT